jgi:hypothetical protein
MTTQDAPSVEKPSVNPEETIAPSETLNSPYCREIRSKRYFFLREMPTEEHHLKDGSNHCWCRVTMKVYGPDGEIARPQDCVAGRTCYRSLFETE